MKFAFVSAMTHYPWAGSEELWGAAALRLKAQAHDVFAIVGRWSQPAIEVQRLSAAGVTVRMRNSPPAATLLTRLKRRFVRQSLPTFSADLAWMKEQKPDLVIVSNGNYFDGSDVMDFCMRESIPFGSICQANAEWLWPNDETASRIVQAYSAAKASFFVARRNLTLAEHQIGSRLSRAEIVRNPYKVCWDANPAWPDESGCTRLACVARYEPPAKGQDLLLEVLAMPKWQNRSIRLELYGAGPMEFSLRRLVDMHGLTNRVSFPGFTHDVEGIWARCHALILPSRYEGLPLAIVEAMLCGRPCIVTDVGGNAELLEDGQTGFVADAPTVSSLDTALERAWHARSTWKAMGRVAQQTAHQLIPKDPGAVFAERLIALAQGAHAS
jgi:glycosyltransferase involved in cell wall biosynthesis